MGCTSCNSISEINDYQQETIEFDSTNNIRELSHAKSLINLIIRIRNKIIFSYHKLIYDTGACIFKKPTIIECVKCIFYKLSYEFEGNIRNADITHKEDLPYLKLSSQVRISDQSLQLFNQLLNFILELVNYKMIIKQIEKEIPELLYLIYETKDKLTNKNIISINKAIELFKNTKQIKNEILISYKNIIFEFVYRKEVFYKKIDAVGQLAYERNISDIYEIGMLEREIRNNNNEENKNNGNNNNEIKMFKSAYNAKIYMENILNNEKNDDIFLSHDSIIENINNSIIYQTQ